MAVDGDSGIGVGTPVAPGVGTGLAIAEPLKYTLLSLPYYAQIMGISPVHFQGATGGTTFPIGACNDVWPRWSWQKASQVSHEDLARAIYDAEQDIARELGYYPAPYWIAQEVHPFPRHHRRDVWRAGGRNVRGGRVSIRTTFGKFIQGGQRAVSDPKIGTATTVGGSLKYSDEDGDGFAETATITMATTLTNECEIKIYHTDKNGEQEWEIRPALSKSADGTTFTAVFRSWLFIDPDLQGAYPTTAGFSAIDISTVANFVASVDVYREYNDYTAAAVTFYWEPKPSNLLAVSCTQCSGSGCAACALTTQDGCLHPRDNNKGIVVPVPATYDSDDEQWDQVAFAECNDPDQVKLYYLAGEYSDRSLGGWTCEVLSNYWAHTITWLATAKLGRPFCSCANVEALSKHLQQDLAFVGESSHQIDLTLLANPFGTKRGEVMAWKRVNDTQGRQIKGGAI